MKKIIYAIVALNSLFSMTALAQKNVVHLDVVSDDPENLKVFKGKLPLWELTMSNNNLSLYDLNVGGVALIKDVFLSAEYSFSAFDRIYPDSYEGNIASNDVSQMIMFPVNKSTPANSLQLEGTYFFHKELITKDLKIVLSGGSNYEKYTMVKGKMLKRFGARVGFKTGVSWYAMNGANISGTDASGTTSSFSYGLMSTNVKYSRLNFGLSYSRTTNLKVETKEFGKKSNSGIDFIYADLLFNIKTTYDDVYSAIYYDGSNSNNTMYYQQFNINEVNDISKIGFRAGYRYVPFKGSLGMHLEGGVAPGIKGVKNLFVLVGASFYFGTKP